ncbi:uncharacterized protein EAF02_001754 [Botrytis sinoallii]|uniref:uncharacterized protein n=1 Tax=Botrytis sinoallii TaxID=1463999 RepID=UPI0018FFA040|nr:uncharacterized protein EAF02_001754 [Botrytis sinoallii]KAF7891429.1 hypothetical protein EAF02_001754 [Botrytis sinoallii]
MRFANETERIWDLRKHKLRCGNTSIRIVFRRTRKRKGTSRKPNYIRVILQLLYAACIQPIHRLVSPCLASPHGYFKNSKHVCALRPVLLSSPNLHSTPSPLSLSLYHHQLGISIRQLNLISISPTHISFAFHRNPPAYLENSTSASNPKSTLLTLTQTSTKSTIPITIPLTFKNTNCKANPPFPHLVRKKVLFLEQKRGGGGK